jgi:hypothetical protein
MPTPGDVSRTMSPPKPLATTPPSVFARTSSSGLMTAWSDRRPGPQQSPTDAGLWEASSPVSAPVSSSTGMAWTAPEGHLLAVFSHRPTRRPELRPSLRPPPTVMLARTCNQVRPRRSFASLRAPFCASGPSPPNEVMPP